MTSHSLVPLDHWTTGLTPAQLRGLVTRHAVHFEVSPYQSIDKDGAARRDGWTLDLYGSPSDADEALERDERVRHVHDVLHAVTVAVKPVIPDGLVVEDEAFHMKTVLDPRRDFAEEIHKRVYVLRDSSVRPTMLGDADTDWTQDLATQLELVGAQRR